MSSLQALRAGAVLVVCLALVAVREADSLRRQRLEHQADDLVTVRPSVRASEVAAEPRPMTPERAGDPDMRVRGRVQIAPTLPVTGNTMPVM